MAPSEVDTQIDELLKQADDEGAAVASSGGPDEATPPDGKIDSAPAKPEPGKEPEPGKFVPYEKFQQVAGELNRLSGLAPLAEEVEKDPSLLHEFRSYIAAKRAGGQPGVQPGVQPQMPAGATPEQQKALLDAWNKKYYENPAEATLLLTDKLAEQKAEAAAGPLYDLAATLVIENYKNTAKSNPMFAASAPIFDTVVNGLSGGSFRGKKPAEIQMLLQTAYYAALGFTAHQAYEKAVKSGTIPVRGGAVPSYEGGTPAGGGGGARLSKASPYAVAVMRRAGFSDDEIRQALKDMETEE